MNKWLSYENAWTRNLVVGSIFFVIIFMQEKYAPVIPNSPVVADYQIILFFLFTYTCVFLNNYFSVKNLLLKRKYGYYVLVTAIYISTLGLITNWCSHYINMPTNGITDFFSAFMTWLMGTALYFIHLWILNNIIKTKKTLLAKEGELTFLKHQLSPHFLFNAINNLYGTALASPDIVPEKILELSDLLRYQIESTTKDVVKMEEEMVFVQNYLNYTNYKTNNLKIENAVIGTITPIYLPPLLFLPLLENAIKYSSESDAPFISITWLFEKDMLQFTIENSYISEGSKINGTKIGIENLKKRIDILKIKHQLKLDINTFNIYKAELKLWGLSTNV
jgi:two-component system, LytTR family, sensor kinase